MNFDLKIFDNILSTGLCESLIKMFNESRFKIPSYEYNNSAERQERKGKIVIMKDDEFLRGYEEEVLLQIRECITKFGREHAGLQVMINDEYILTRPRIEEISLNEGFDWHMDARQHSGDRRFLGILVYLNDVYEGGETEFYFQNCIIKPKQGRVLIFPPYWSHIHRGNKPLSNVKYTIGLFATLK